MIHELKTWPQYFESILRGNKTFEVRKNDRRFNVFDVLHLREYDPKTQSFTGREIFKGVSYILFGGDFGVLDGTVVMSIKDIPQPDEGQTQNEGEEERVLKIDTRNPEVKFLQYCVKAKNKTIAEQQATIQQLRAELEKWQGHAYTAAQEGDETADELREQIEQLQNKIKELEDEK